MYSPTDILNMSISSNSKFDEQSINFISSEELNIL